MPDPTGPDPLAELENFSSPGLTMDPLPAAEVRRRGTRMRRRNNALAAVAGVAAVAVIATPLAIAANRGSTDSTPPPATQSPSPTVSWMQEIPADFDLTSGLPAGTRQRGVAAVGRFALCGDDVWNEDSPAPVDAAGAEHEDPGSEGTVDRTLVLYPDAATADEVMARFRSGILDCPTEQGNTAATQTVNAVVDTDLGTDESFIFTTQVKEGDLLYDLTAYLVVRAGNALLLSGTHTSAGGPTVVNDTVVHLTSSTSRVLDAMCTFSTDPC